LRVFAPGTAENLILGLSTNLTVWFSAQATRWRKRRAHYLMRKVFWSARSVRSFSLMNKISKNSNRRAAMLCEKCQWLTLGSEAALGHSDLAHVDLRFYTPLRAPRTEARTDEYRCQTCGTRWERDFDPAVLGGYSVFREVA